VNHNKIKQFDVGSFEARNPIKVLKIDDNGLKNFNNIQKLVRLQHLFANSNRINEFHDVDRLCELVYLKELELNGNSLYRKPGYRVTLVKKLPNLVYLDGRVLLFLCRKFHPKKESISKPCRLQPVPVITHHQGTFHSSIIKDKCLSGLALSTLRVCLLAIS
jgi:hypothetical protein